MSYTLTVDDIAMVKAVAEECGWDASDPIDIYLTPPTAMDVRPKFHMPDDLPNFVEAAAVKLEKKGAATFVFLSVYMDDEGKRFIFCAVDTADGTLEREGPTRPLAMLRALYAAIGGK